MTTKWEIQERVARNLGDLKFSGVLTSATNAGTYGVVVLNDLALSLSSDLDNGFAFIGGVDYRIAVFDPPDKSIYLLPTFATVPAAGATAYLFKNFSKADYNVAFDTVYRRLAGRILEDVEASAAVSTLPSYSIDSEWKYLNKVELYETDEYNPLELDPMYWYIRSNDLFLKKAAPTSAYATLIALGQKHPDLPATDAATVHANGIFQDCLGYRMIEQLGIAKLRSVTQNQTTAATAAATTFGTVTTLGTMSQTATTGMVATSVATLAVLEHVTGREERNAENQVQTTTEQSTGLTQNSETNDSFTESFNQQYSQLSEENWQAFIEAAVAAADALEVYLFERPKPNSRRLR
jgi:hypothetical protein